MRKTVIALTALLLVSFAAPVWAQTTKPGDGGASAPGSEPAQPPGPAPDQGPNLFPGDVHVSVGGESVQQAPAGSAARVTVEVFNGGSETVRDITAHIEAVEGATVSDADSAVADIEPNANEPARFTITPNETNCQDFAAFLITFKYSGGSNESKFGVPVACPGPRLSIENVRFAGGDGDGVPEPGETIRAFVVLRNEGRDAATNVTARVTVSGKGLTTVSDDLSWSDIAPGTTEESSSPIVIDIPKDAPKQDPCPGPIFGVPPSGVVPPDSTVSSDGGSGGSGTAPSGAASSGTVEIQPAPATTSPEPVVTATDDPTPIAPPQPGTPEPEPSADQPIGMEMAVAVKATGYSESLGYGNGIACAVEAVANQGGVPALGAAPAPAQPKAARDTAAASERTGSRSGAAAATVGIAAAFALVAIVARRFLVD